MTDKQKASASGDTDTNASAKNDHQRSKQGHSRTNSIPQNDPDVYKQLYELIPEGHEHDARNTKALAKLLDWHTRDVTKGIHALRTHGSLICSSKRGYWRPVDVADIRRYIKGMRHRMREIEKATVPAERYLARWGGDHI